MPEVRVSHEAARGCGFRREGGLYLVGPPDGRACCVLPMPVHVCPTCNTGIKPARGWTWINIGPYVREAGPAWGSECATCPLAQMALDGGWAVPEAETPAERPDRVGLLWIGESFYPTPDAFLAEAQEQTYTGERRGISRRISAVPRDFVLGETFVALAHRTGAVLEPSADDIQGPVPAIFAFFKPTAIERIVSDEEAADAGAMEELRARGLTPVIVRRIGEQGALGLDDADDFGGGK